MLLRNNRDPIVTNDGSTVLYGRLLLDNKTSIDNDFLKKLFMTSRMHIEKLIYEQFNSGNRLHNNNYYGFLGLGLSYSNESFNIRISDEYVNITGRNDKEILLGIVYLLGLRNDNYVVPNQIITDEAKTNHREFMLDIARNIVSESEIKKIIDEMFFNRINYLHLHFSDDENYAIESSIHPELNTKSFLTKEEVKSIIAYTKERGIEVIPEFDMPGHLNHLLDINNDLRCKQNKGNSICFGKNHDYLFELIDEICELFPCEYFHIGGDELGIKNQCSCPVCRKLMKEKNYKNPKRLASDFINQVSLYLQNKGKKVIVWNDALRYGRINEDVIIQKWFNYPFDKTCLDEYMHGRKIIIASATDTYLGGPYSLTPLRKIYNYASEINNHVIAVPYGVSSHLWTEVIKEEDEIEKGMYPSLQAFGENAWLDYERLDYNDFLSRLEKELDNLSERENVYTPINVLDKFSIGEVSDFLKKKLRFKNYTDFSTLALIKMISEYHFDRKSNKLVRHK